MKTLAVIPARLGATRLPRKPLRLLAGLPIILRVWERVAAMEVAERCVVATDSEEVAHTVRQHGGEAVITRDDHPSGTDRVAEIAGRREFASYDLIVNVQGDEPFVSEQAIAGAVSMISEAGFPLGTAAVRAPRAILDDPNTVKVVAADDGQALYFSRAPIPFLMEQENAADRDDHIWQHIGLYAYVREALLHWVALPIHPLERAERLEQLRPLAAGTRIGVFVTNEPARTGIDTERDLERANQEWVELSHIVRR